MTLSIRPILAKLAATASLAAALTLPIAAGAAIEDFEVRQDSVLNGGNQLAVHDGVAEIEDCAVKCDEHPSCASFYYRADIEHCEIKSGNEFAPGEWFGHVSAVSLPIRRYVTAQDRGASGNWVETGFATSANECAQLCDTHGDGCRSFTFAPDENACWMYDGTHFSAGTDPSWTAGIKREYTHRVVPVYVVPSGATALADYAEIIEAVMVQNRNYFLWQLGSTFEYDAAEIVYTDRPATDFTAGTAVRETIGERFADGFNLEKNTYVFVTEGGEGGAWGGGRAVMIGGFWQPIVDAYPGDLSGSMAAWPHELGHAFGLRHTGGAGDTKECLLGEGVDMGDLHPSLIMWQAVGQPSVFDYPIAPEEKQLLLDPGYFPNCRLNGMGDPHSVAILNPIEIPAAFCGDAVLSGPEQCDDGNASGGDGCDRFCRIEPACGDGTIDVGESCDDGNEWDGDGCDSFCQVEPACGDGMVDANEQCDDGNVQSGDGCDSFCQLEAIEFCGDGGVDMGEQCDDGNTFSGDGCSAFCQVELVCGDGVVDAGERCDDGNVFAGDGCDEFCQIEVSASCGDGIVDAGEQCDDGNVRGGDGCDAFCQIEGSTSCGDGTVDAGEQCDDRNLEDGDGCSAICEIEEQAGPFQPMRGKKLKIRDGGQVTPELSRLGIVLKDVFSLPAPGLPGDPRCPIESGMGGARLTVTGTSGASYAQDLPCTNWRAIGRKTFKGYKYVDNDGAHGACSRVVLKNGKVKAKCAGAGMDFDLVVGEAVLEVGVQLELAEETTLCAAFQPADPTRDGRNGEKLKAGPSGAPAMCQ